jgi:hypothetical protein
MRSYLTSTILSRAPFAAFAAEPNAIGGGQVAQSDVCETVTVKGKHGPVTMNKSEYDENPKKFGPIFEGDAKHNADGTAKLTKKQQAEAADDPNTITAEDKALAERIEAANFGVIQDGKRYYIALQHADGSLDRKANYAPDGMDENSKEAKEFENEFPTIERDGYKSSKEAFTAIQITKTQATDAMKGIAV